MRGILADVNAEGHVGWLITIFESDDWVEFWTDMDLDVESFAGLDLDRNTPDDEVWRRCQAEDLVLITGNRNHAGPDSLEAAMRAENTVDSLPVITIADANRIIYDRTYAVQTAVRILEYLTAIEHHLGAGRLFAP